MVLSYLQKSSISSLCFCSHPKFLSLSKLRPTSVTNVKLRLCYVFSFLFLLTNSLLCVIHIFLHGKWYWNIESTVYIITDSPIAHRVGVPEWLSGMTRNHVGFARAGSNPAAHGFLMFFCLVFF
ncbi:hypothetical protein I3842_13G086200 [Carya illinoinensis]|uniref:Uncharacterized protein n=1 Tax=Carya illinoinensis TaxID=32201 RepID=A0A922AP42_CARIL|nr:hypothetical protein I3842_13G086200 [Carya illinoinensis]